MMFGWLKAQVLSCLSIPPEPEPPAGSQASLLVFRASPRYLRYRMARWGLGRALVLFVGLAVASALIVPGMLIAKKLAPLPAASRELEPAPVAPSTPGKKKGKPITADIAPQAVTAVFVVLGSGVLLWFVVHSLLSYVTLRLDYELRWYKVTDRSLRIREGVWVVREMTMSFANIQNISLSQGPLQKYFGVSDLMVESAGGGAPQPGVESLHAGYFRGVDNAEQIRTMMQERLRTLRDGGLGDHEDRSATTQAERSGEAAAWASDDASREAASLLEEARGFRAAAERLEGASP
jgi:membrane protein YdbS with pleckstrin-like domain